jgi:hypothetical protein
MGPSDAPGAGGSLQPALLKLRVAFHTSLAARLALRCDPASIPALVEALSDASTFAALERQDSAARRWAWLKVWRWCTERRRRKRA